MRTCLVARAQSCSWCGSIRQCITVKTPEICTEEATSRSELGWGKQVVLGVLEELPFGLILREGKVLAEARQAQSKGILS